MSRTLLDILIDANATLDLSAEAPTGTELVLRANYANQAVLDAAAIGQFSEFDRIYETNTSTLATISLPSDFHEFKVDPQVLDSSGVWQEYKEILPKDKYGKSSADKYCYVLGNPSEGYVAVFNQLISMATLSILYQRSPSGLLTLTDVCELPDPTYVTRKVESYVLYARGDDRLAVAEGRAQQSLKNMAGREMKTPGGGMRMTGKTFSNPLK